MLPFDSLLSIYHGFLEGDKAVVKASPGFVMHSPKTNNIKI